MATEPRLRLAIIGGGLAGVTLANALLQIPHLEVHIYEAASTFSERGAAVAFDAHALQTLDDILSAAKKDEILSKAGAVSLNSVRNVMGSGPYAGQIIFDQGDGEEAGVVVHRASLLRELVAQLPTYSMHTSKSSAKLVHHVGDGTVEVTFQDQTAETFNAVIGADGIFSNVRSHILQDDADKFAASPAGFWDCRTLVPMEKAEKILGADLFQVNRQCGYVGDGAFVMTDVLDNRATVQCIISAVEPSPTQVRKRRLTRDDLNETLRGWPDAPIGKGIMELSLDQPDLHGYSQWEHKATPTYSNGQVCIIGDAAHAMTPWQGSGAAMACEDVVILKELLQSCRSSADCTAAFIAFDSIRRPRCQRIIDSSRETGGILCGRDNRSGLEPDKIGGLLAHQWDFIMGIDLSAHKANGLEAFHKFSQG